MSSVTPTDGGGQAEAVSMAEVAAVPSPAPPQEDVVAAPAPAADVRVPVYVWDLVVRSTHWLIVGSIVVLAATGFYIGRPFVTTSGSATEHFFMGWVKIVHFYTAIVFTLAVVARVIWMFWSRLPYARWTQFVPVARKRRRDLWGTFKFYIFLRAEPPPAIGHNPLAGLTYVAVFVLYFVMILTGLGLYAMNASYASPVRSFTWFLAVFGGPQSTRWVHHVVMWLLLGFAVHHIYSASLMAKIEKNGTIDSIIGGYKQVRRSEVEDGR